MGISSKSEKGKKPKPTPPGKTEADRLAELKARRAKLLVEIRRYEDRLGKGRKKRQKKPPGPVADSSAALLPSEEADPSYQRSTERVFTGCLAQPVEESKVLTVEREQNFENPRGLHVVQDDRTRYEHAVTTKTIHLKVETVTDLRTGKSVTAITDEIGELFVVMTDKNFISWKLQRKGFSSTIGCCFPISLNAILGKS
jgi:hypothetical protein